MKPTEQKRLHRISPDLRMNHVGGISILIIGAAIAYSLVFTSFEQRVEFQWELNEGRRVPITHVTCPSPWSVVRADAQPEGVVGGDLCVLPSRGMLVQGVVVAIIALALAIWVFTRDTRPKPMPTLPPTVRALLWKR